MVDLGPQYLELKRELDEAALGVLAGCRYILGPEVESFEREFSAFVGAEHGVGVSNGTSAVEIAVKALGLEPGDEVLTTSMSFIATADSFARCGIRPAFADIDPRTFNLDPASVSERLTSRTRAILAVHLYGQPADMDALLEIGKLKDIPVLEDCAQAHGAVYRGRRVGSMGAASAFSFFPTKPLGGAGDGGFISTSDAALADRARMLRAHGSRKKYLHEVLGANSRLDELQAALLRIKLPRLEAWNESRRRTAALYDKNLSGVTVPYVAPDVNHVYHQYTVRTPERERLIKGLAERGVGSTIYYPIPIHLQPCFSSLGYTEGDLPECEKASREVLSLPMYYGIPDSHVERVCEAVSEVMR